MFGEDIPNLSIKAEAGWPSGNCSAAEHVGAWRPGKAAHITVVVFSGRVPQSGCPGGQKSSCCSVGLNLGYISVWSGVPKPLGMPSTAHEDPLVSLIAKMGMRNFSIWSCWFWTSPEAAHPKLPQTAADVPSEWPLFPQCPWPLVPQRYIPQMQSSSWRARDQRLPTTSSTQSLSHQSSLTAVAALQCSFVAQFNVVQDQSLSCMHCMPFVADSCYLF